MPADSPPILTLHRNLVLTLKTCCFSFGRLKPTIDKIIPEVKDFWGFSFEWDLVFMDQSEEHYNLSHFVSLQAWKFFRLSF